MRYRRPKDHEAQQMLRLCREKAGTDAVTSEEVVKFAIGMGMKIPADIPGERILEKDFSRAFRNESKYDPQIKGSYRINHVYPGMRNGKQTMLWGDIHTIPHPAMLSSAGLRRKGMVNDGYHLKLDLKMWNLLHPKEPSIEVVYDLTEDIAEMESGNDDAASGDD